MDCEKYSLKINNVEMKLNLLGNYNNSVINQINPTIPKEINAKGNDHNVTNKIKAYMQGKVFVLYL